MSATATPPAVDEATGARSELYGLLADAIDFPSSELHLRAEAGVLRDEVAALLRALPYDVGFADAVAGLAAVDDYVALQSEYIRLFDVGVVRPPCPLYGGEWGGARKHSMEEVLRFYRFFGLKLAEDGRELPDHVTIELEFMRVMALTEGMARANGGDVLHLLRAERDFLQRHPGRWWPKLEQKLSRQAPPPFYASVARVIGAVLEADAAYLSAAIAAAPRP